MSLPIYVLREGDKGQQVGRLRAALGLTAGEVFDKALTSAVKAYQKLNKLSVDGVAGPQTLGMLGLYPLFGIDVSHYQGNIDWKKAVAFGVQWACVKVGQGNGGTDPKGSDNIRLAREAGLQPLAYHFAVPDKRQLDAKAEAACAVERSQGCQLVLDLEQTGGLGPVALGDWTGTFLSEVERLTGQLPWLYTTGDYLKNRIKDEDLCRYPKWIARIWHEKEDPGVGVAWKAWQFSWTGNIPGIKGDVDCDWIV